VLVPNRIAAAVIITTCLSTLPAYAADEASRAIATNPSAATDVTTEGAGGGDTVPVQRTPIPLPESRISRPALLSALYASYAALQGYDAYSTTQALAGGGHEANPMMKGLVGNPALFWTVKAMATVAPMVAAERLWKTNKVGAIAVMAAGNGVMAIVAAHNASVLNRQR
jgi:hypothetical protein